ncbi:MAG TPA: radical SAM protein, partial [Candidatus Wallbacteria bacterium]|nr:radical SAM protein [Candidatus Wallbacteria bacterium]
RADIMNERVLRALKDSGAYNLTVAVESASPRLQKLMKKGVNIEKAAKVIDMAADMGFIVNGFFMLGFPGETYYEMMGTIDFAVQSKLHHALFFSVNPHGFTELSETYYKKQTTEECKGTEKFHYFNRYFHLSEVSPVMFSYIMLYANLKFYMQLRRVWALIKIAPSFSKFITQGIFFFFSIAYYNLKYLIRTACHEYFPFKSRRG